MKLLLTFPVHWNLPYFKTQKPQIVNLLTLIKPYISKRHIYVHEKPFYACSLNALQNTANKIILTYELHDDLSNENISFHYHYRTYLEQK
jgi:hypothetical protein